MQILYLYNIIRTLVNEFKYSKIKNNVNYEYT
jgi:hypothetical protein